MDIPINAKVYCQDKLCGHTQAVILDPDSEVVTHVVVKERKIPHTQRLVPIDTIDASLENNIQLNCDQAKFESMPPFVDVEYVQASIPYFTQACDYDLTYPRPIIIPERKMVSLKHYHLPGNELAVRQGIPVYSAEGYVVGKVDEFLVDRGSGNITHLILREGHLWGQKDVVIPAEEIDKVKETKLRLKLKKNEIGDLPSIPVKPKFI